MACQFSVVCEQSQARRVESLARKYGLSREEVLRQLISVGLEELENQPTRGSAMTDSSE